MSFSRGAIGPANSIYAPFEFAWQTSLSETSAGVPPRVTEAVFFEDLRSDNRVLLVLATVVARDDDAATWLRYLEYVLASDPTLHDLAPPDLFHRLHAYLTAIFRKNPGGWGAVHATALLVDPSNQYWRIYCAGHVPPLLSREVGGWEAIPTLRGPYLGVPGTGAWVGKTAETLFPPNPASADPLAVAGDALAIVSRGMYDAPAPQPPPRRFGTADDGLVASLKIVPASSPAAVIVPVVSTYLRAFSGPRGLDGDATILMMRLTHVPKTP